MGGRRGKVSRPVLQRQKKASSWNRGEILLSAETGTEGGLRSSLCLRHKYFKLREYHSPETGVRLRISRKSGLERSAIVWSCHGDIAE